MHESFYFYDLETSGLSSHTDRIMQFAGMRTDSEFNPIGEPDNLLIQLPDDTLPSPSAIMVTGITPNATRLDGISEREFCEFFMEHVALPNTTIMGYNSVRFDDEFIRNLFWRNFYDPYIWQWQDNRSRWDLLDVVRLTRALRPEGINWPVTPEGRPTNRLELITKENHIAHQHAHDALSDVEALVSVTKLIREKQPQLFDYLYRLRNKREVMQLVDSKNPRPFVYASGRYPSEFMHATVAYPISDVKEGGILVYDLRYNLDELLAGEAAAEKAGTINPEKPYREREPWERNYFPIVKKMQYNRCPAVAPLGVLEKADGWKKIQLDRATVERNLKSLQNHPKFIHRMRTQMKAEPYLAIDPEAAIYDGFLNQKDQNFCAVIRSNDADDLADFHPAFDDERLPDLLLHYKGRNFPESLTADEAEKWQAYRHARLERQAPKFLQEIADIKQHLAKHGEYNGRSVKDAEYLLEEMMLWYQSLQD